MPQGILQEQRPALEAVKKSALPGRSMRKAAAFPPNATGRTLTRKPW